jgi:hypothetical protein
MTEAALFDEISEQQLALWRTTWVPVMQQSLQDFKKRQIPTDEWPEDLHWDWDLKLKDIKGLLAYRTLCLVCQDQVQGLMMLDLTKSSRLSSQAGKPLVYVEFLATAPWNRKELTTSPVFRGVGSVLIYVAIQVSLEEQFHGRIGLHSLPRANDFYQNVCGMTLVGPDPQKQNLCYFEMTRDQAKRFRP